jgi:hypothetical protein
VLLERAARLRLPNTSGSRVVAVVGSSQMTTALTNDHQHGMMSIGLGRHWGAGCSLVVVDFDYPIS